VQTGTTPNCNVCGSTVSHRFAKIFGDNDDEIYGCLECSTKRVLHSGGAASIDD
jgi:hypothetical protein